MNPSLVVLSSGKWQGKVIALSRSPFLIGRGDGCTLRPASPQVGERHCAIVLRDGKAFVQDLSELASTLIDDVAVEGTVEIHHGQQLRVGPLLFEIRLSQNAEKDSPSASADEEAAALLLEGRETNNDDGWTSASPRPAPVSKDEDEDPGPLRKGPRAAPPTPDTREAARNILKKYGKLTGLKRPKKKDS
jgi:predicted component of type VI protein secretion system